MLELSYLRIDKDNLTIMGHHLKREELHYKSDGISFTDPDLAFRHEIRKNGGLWFRIVRVSFLFFFIFGFDCLVDEFYVEFDEF
jgi:hypothetical protein